MLVAVPSDQDTGMDSRVADHFGRCPFFTMLEIEDDGEVRQVTSIPNPCFEAHAPGQVPIFLNGEGADVILAGGMGRRAIAIFSDMGIQTCTGARGTVRETISAYLEGTLEGGPACPGGVGSQDGGCGHDHSH
jgi:predicted Fe-Mo cluster-binding NifX family protein